MQTTRQQSQSIPSDIAALFARDARIVRVVHYLSGWVPNSYRYPAPGTARTYRRHEDGRIDVQEIGYDRKRSFARGPRLVGFSARGGRLVSA